MKGPHRQLVPLILSTCLLLVTTAAVSPTYASEYRMSSEALPELGGWWAQKMVLTAVSDPPFVGTVTNETINYLLIRVTQDGRQLTLKSQVCDVDVDSDFTKVRTIIPDAFADALPDSTRTGELTRRDNRWRLEVDRVLNVVGARLREPTSERLPTSADDPRVVDGDDDGRPGLTVKIRGMVNGKIFVVQRGWDAYSGTIFSEERIRGDVRWSTEQKVLGSTSIFLGDQPPTEPHEDADRSFFEMVRLDGSPSCSDVSADLFKD